MLRYIPDMSTIIIPEPESPITCQLFQEKFQEMLDQPYSGFPTFFDVKLIKEVMCEVLCKNLVGISS